MNDLGTTPPVETPVSVPASAIPEQLASALRTLLAALGGYAVAKGWLTADVAAALVPVVLIGLPLLWSQFKVRRSNAKMRTMADRLPDWVAKVG